MTRRCSIESWRGCCTSVRRACCRCSEARFFRARLCRRRGLGARHSVSRGLGGGGGTHGAVCVACCESDRALPQRPRLRSPPQSRQLVTRQALPRWRRQLPSCRPCCRARRRRAPRCWACATRTPRQAAPARARRCACRSACSTARALCTPLVRRCYAVAVAWRWRQSTVPIPPAVALVLGVRHAWQRLEQHAGRQLWAVRARCRSALQQHRRQHERCIPVGPPAALLCADGGERRAATVLADAAPRGGRVPRRSLRKPAPVPARRTARDRSRRLPSCGRASLPNVVCRPMRGRYRSLPERLLRMRLVSAAPGAVRQLNLEHLNRQLVWGELGELLLFFLPLFDMPAARRVPRVPARCASLCVRRCRVSHVAVAALRSRRLTGNYWGAPRAGGRRRPRRAA